MTSNKLPHSGTKILILLWRVKAKTKLFYIIVYLSRSIYGYRKLLQTLLELNKVRTNKNLSDMTGDSDSKRFTCIGVEFSIFG